MSECRVSGALCVCKGREGEEAEWGYRGVLREKVGGGVYFGSWIGL